VRILGWSELDELTATAKQESRRRKMLSLHMQQDYVQRMFNAVHSDAYFQPHRHLEPAKSETMLIVRGRIGAITFNDDGSILETALLDPDSEMFCVDFPRLSWHSIVVFEDDSLIFEAKEGPYDQATDKQFAPWAPSEESDEAFTYLNELKTAILSRAD